MASHELTELTKFALEAYRKHRAQEQAALAPLEARKLRHFTRGPDGKEVDITEELAAERRGRIALYDRFIALYEADLKAP